MTKHKDHQIWSRRRALTCAAWIAISFGILSVASTPLRADDNGSSHDGESNDGGDTDHSGDGSDGNRGSDSQENGSVRSRDTSGGQLRDAELAKQLRGRIATLQQIRRTATNITPGEIVDIRLRQEGETVVYRLKIIDQSGTLRFVKFNAKTQKLISTQ